MKSSIAIGSSIAPVHSALHSRYRQAVAERRTGGIATW